MSELREAFRRRVFLGGRIEPAPDTGPPPPDPACLLRNLSPGGAMLRLAGPAALPARFTLVVGCRDARYRTVLVWQRGEAAGVRFLPDDAGTADRLAELVEGLRASRAEVARLRERLALLETDPRPPDARLH